MTASSQDLKDLLRLADSPVEGFTAPGAKLRWTSPPALALVLARWATREGRMQSLWVDAPSEAEARTLAQDLQVLLPGAGVAHFPGFAAYAGGESSPPGMVLRGWERGRKMSARHSGQNRPLSVRSSHRMADRTGRLSRD